MKRLLLMVVAFFTATSIAVANPTSKMDMLSMSKADSSFLFNGKANVIALNTTEMKQTEGEGFWVGMGFFISYGAYGLYTGRYNPYTHWRLTHWGFTSNPW